MALPKLLIFATGTKDGGGTAFENLVSKARTGRDLKADIVGVVSNYELGGVRIKADSLAVKFFYFPGPWDAEGYQRIAKESGAEWFALAGWLKMVKGLDPKRTFNLHPAPLTLLGGKFGGAKMYQHHVHEAVHTAYKAGEITESGPSMHFVTEEYDRGPVFFEYRISIDPGMTAKEIAEKVNTVEREWHPKITDMIIHEEISWDGKDPASLKVPLGYQFLPSKS